LIAFLVGLLLRRQPEKQSQNIQHETNRNNGKTLPDGPLSVVCIPPTPTDEEKAKKKDSERRKIFKLWLEVGGLTVLIFYTTFAALQWDAMRQTVRVDQRPWIKITEHFEPLQAFNNVTVHLEFLNYGKTPAQHIDAKFAIERVRNGESPKLNFPKLHFGLTTGIIFPNSPEPQSFSMLHPDSTPSNMMFYSLSQQDFMDYQEQKIFFVVYAEVRYWDFFRVEHVTHFCNYIATDKPGGFVSAMACTDYNGVDNNY
jgi:hypothetical protein